MKIKFGRGNTKFGPGVDILLTGEEVAKAIESYLFARGVHVHGPRTITVNNAFCGIGRVYVDPSGSVIAKSKRITGRGKIID